jgi:hypothetical protein
MGWIEGQLKALAQRTEYLFRLLQQIQAQLTNARQQGYAGWQSGGNGSGSASVPYAFVPSANIAAASGQPPSGTPASLTGQTIYALASGAWSTVTTSGVVYNGLLTVLDSGYTTYCLKNNDGTFLAITQDCTS